MKNLVFCFLLLTVSSVNAQIKWCYKINNSFNGISHSNSYLIGELLTYSVVESSYYMINAYGAPFHVAEVRADSSRKVYVTFIEMGTEVPEILLYDFSLEVGDTMYYDYGGYPPEGIMEQYHYKVVTETETISINNQTRKTSSLLS
ncbi:MAG: hypothetical protein RBT65_17015 [Methanolobus sp.]|nr:hypothetical protein [Methanolobus sp.]